MTEWQQKAIKRAFSHHAPKNAGQIERYERIRSSCLNLAAWLCESCPDSRELNTALSRLEEVQSWAIAAIARNE